VESNEVPYLLNNPPKKTQKKKREKNGVVFKDVEICLFSRIEIIGCDSFWQNGNSAFFSRYC